MKVVVFVNVDGKIEMYDDDKRPLAGNTPIPNFVVDIPLEKMDRFGGVGSNSAKPEIDEKPKDKETSKPRITFSEDVIKFGRGDGSLICILPQTTEMKDYFRGFDEFVEQPKKTVVKEAAATGEVDLYTVTYKFPSGAKNIKCTYEIEE